MTAVRGRAWATLMELETERFTERTLSIPADLSRLPEARRFADEIASAVGFDRDVCQQIKLATNEATANAVEHGSRSTDDIVELRAAEEDGALAIYIADGGSFVPRMSPRGSLPERGRGMAFMDLLMDDVQVQPGAAGTVVRLAKRLPE